MAFTDLVLAGPIVRRVEPGLVAVWVALSETARVKLSVFSGAEKQIDPLQLPADADPTAPAANFAGPAERARRIGENLHVAVATVEPPVSLLPGKVYSYNLSFEASDFSGTFTPTDDLRSLGLLTDNEADERPHLALGYTANTLPSFVTCPDKLEDLRVVHGSCRAIGRNLEDALAWVDDFIIDGRQEPTLRPHMALLAGDQIYADDVPNVMSTYLRTLGHELMGAQEFLPMRWSDQHPVKPTSSTTAEAPAPATMRPVDDEHLPGAMRHRLIDTEARMTSKDKHSHLISFGEFCAMYLLVWSNVAWDLDALEDFDTTLERIVKRQQLPPNWGSLFLKHAPDPDDQLTEADIKPVLDMLFTTGMSFERVRGILRNENRDSEGFNYKLLHPAGLILAKHLSVTDADRALLEDINKLTHEQREGIARRSIDKASAKEVELTIQSLVMPAFKRRSIEKFSQVHDPLLTWILETAAEVDRQLSEYRAVFETAHAAAFPGGQTEVDFEGLWRFQTALKTIINTVGGLFRKTTSPDTRQDQVRRFHAKLTNVRRGLANVSTYMIFDDHEVTDDWNLGEIWVDRVYTAPLGRTILRNGLAAYGVFQGWGNDPAAFADGPNGTFLDLVTNLVPPGQNTPPPPDNATTRDLDELLGLNPSRESIAALAELEAKHAEESEIAEAKSALGSHPPEPKVAWHFQVPGPRHRIFVLDNRTRRSFRSRTSPPSNVAAKFLKQQLPTRQEFGDSLGIELAIVVAPLTVMGASLIDDLIAPGSYRAFDWLAQKEIDGMAGTNPDAVESWLFAPNEMEELLRRASTWGKAIFLSGDVHHGASQQMSYWPKGQDKPARLAQFTSSGMRNVMPSYLRTLSRTFGFMQKLARADIDVVRFGWKDDKPGETVFGLPPGTSITPSLRSRLNTKPMLFPKHGLPPGTQFNIAPDWRWEMQEVVDERDESARPESAQVASLGPDDELPEAGNLLEHYHRIATHHALQLDQRNHTRQIMFANNVGIVSFTRDDDGLKTSHELHAAHPEADDSTRHEVFARHVVDLDLIAPLPEPAAGS